MREREERKERLTVAEIISQPREPTLMPSRHDFSYYK